MALNPLNQNLVKFSILTVILQFISNGSAIKCFVCDSGINPGCADLKSNSSIVAEECTLDKMRSINTWLFELNKFAYFDKGDNKSPLMNCQKVVARDRNTNQLVTARFCQLNTGESDACSILRIKLRKLADDPRGSSQSYNSNNNNYNNGRRTEQPPAEDDNDFHCSICEKDNCNGGTSMRSSILTLAVGGCGSLLTALMTGHLQQLAYRLW